jgi:phosphoglycolate phosphatase
MSHSPKPSTGESAASGKPEGAATGDPELLLFDFDGTVADTLEVSHGILNDLAAEFGFRPLPSGELEAARAMGTRQFIRHLGISNWRIPKLAKRGLQLLHERIGTVNPIAGMPEVLAELHGRGHRIGILTSNSESNVEAFLSRHNLPYFHFVRTSSKLFGKGREMRKILAKEKCPPAAALYVGDETRDIEAARETGLTMAAVTWGYNTAEALRASAPDHLVHSPPELLLLGGRV